MKPQIGLRTHGGALALYGVLLVLPTLVLGFLQWHHIQTEAERELGEVPRDAEDAASRLRRALQEELDRLVAGETARPFEHYARFADPLYLTILARTKFSNEADKLRHVGTDIVILDEAESGRAVIREALSVFNLAKTD